MRVLVCMKTAKIFMNGRSQAVRLPKECRFDCDEVFIQKQGDKVILTAKKPDWDEFFDAVSVFGDLRTQKSFGQIETQVQGEQGALYFSSDLCRTVFWH